MKPHQSTREVIFAALPDLRAYAASLSGSRERADDLVQETLVRAFNHVASFRPGTNARAWLITILRNYFWSECRKRRREVEDIDGNYATTLTCPPHQEIWMDFQDLRRALATLPLEQRDALILVCGSELTYDEAADICGCPVGTIKSRVSRARASLVRLLSADANRQVSHVLVQSRTGDRQRGFAPPRLPHARRGCGGGMQDGSRPLSRRVDHVHPRNSARF